MGMTAGKNPRSFKKKGQQKKKVVHAFNKKEWYNVRAPTAFEVRVPTLTPCNKAQGQNIPADSLRGRIFQITHADLNQTNKHDLAWRVVRLQVEEVKGFDCFTNFNGISITRRQNRQVKATCYAKASKIKQIRQKMQEIMVNETQKSSLKDLFKKLLADQLGKQITDECNKIFPLQNVLVHKAKVLKKPKFDLTKLMELYAEEKSEAPVAAASENKVEA